MPTHSLSHALNGTLCNCDRATRLQSACVVCGRDRDHFTADALANERDTCGKRCFTHLWNLQLANGGELH